MADTRPAGGAIDPATMTVVGAPCGDCPPSTRRLWRPTDRAVDALAELLLDLARADLERERRQADQGDQGDQKGGAA